jgi:hypothetical protein
VCCVPSAEHDCDDETRYPVTRTISTSERAS